MVAVDLGSGDAADGSGHATDLYEVAGFRIVRDRKLDGHHVGRSCICVDTVIRIRRINRRVDRAQRGDVVVVATVLDVDFLVRAQSHEVIRVGRNPVPQLAADALKQARCVSLPTADLLGVAGTEPNFVASKPTTLVGVVGLVPVQTRLKLELDERHLLPLSKLESDCASGLADGNSICLARGYGNKARTHRR